MKISAAVLCLALASAWQAPARGQEVRPTFADLEPGPDALETYRLNALEIVHEEESASFPTIFVGRSKWWRPVRGKFRYSTSYDDLYLKLGRDDLGTQHRHRRALSETLFWGGLLVSVGGLGVMLSGLATHHDTRAELGIGMFAGGYVLTSVGSAIQPPLVSEEDAEAMARAYNRGLQVHLGVTPVATRDGALHPFGLNIGHSW